MYFAQSPILAPSLTKRRPCVKKENKATRRATGKSWHLISGRSYPPLVFKFPPATLLLTKLFETVSKDSFNQLPFFSKKAIMKQATSRQMTWEEIQKAYPNEWILLGDPQWVGPRVVAGEVLFHGTDKRIVCMEGPARRKGFKTITAVFTGKSAVASHSGLLRPIVQA